MNSQFEERFNLPNWSLYREDNFQFVPQGKIKVLQIGAYTGDTTQWLLSNRDIELIDDVDVWHNIKDDGSQGYNIVDMQKVEQLWDLRFANNSKVNKHKGTSDNFFNSLPQEPIYDFIYIDGCHDALQTALDGLNAFKVLKSGGILAFDDYDWSFEEDHFLRPRRGIDAFVSICEGRIRVLEVPNSQWKQKWIQKH